MDSNKEDSVKCYLLSKKFANEGVIDRALHFAEKAIKLFPTDEYETWLNQLKIYKPPTTTTPDTTTSTTKSSTYSGLKKEDSHESENENKTKTFTTHRMNRQDSNVYNERRTSHVDHNNNDNDHIQFGYGKDDNDIEIDENKAKKHKDKENISSSKDSPKTKNNMEYTQKANVNFKDDSSPLSKKFNQTERMEHETKNPSHSHSRHHSFTKDQLASVQKFQQINKNDFYAILGVSKTASDDEIKKSYRRMALLYHPDKNAAPGADEAFKAVGRAFAVLNDPQKRHQYDLYGEEIKPELSSGASAFYRHGEANPFEYMSRRHPEFFNFNVEPEDLFNMFFSELSASDMHGSRFSFSSRRFSPSGNMYTTYRSPRFATSSQRESNQQRQLTPLHVLSQLIPLFILLILSFINQLLFNWTDRNL